MNNLYNLIESLDSYLEIFEKFANNKTLEKYNDLKKSLNIIKNFVFSNNIVPEEIFDELDDFKVLYEMIKKLANDKALYDNEKVYISIGLTKKLVNKAKAIYDEVSSEQDSEKLNELFIFLKKEIIPKIWYAEIQKSPSEEMNGFTVYNINFYNVQSNVHSPQKEQTSFISQDYKSIFGVILSFAEKLNIDFDQSIFYAMGSIERIKDVDDNGRIKSYFMALKGFLKKKYNIDGQKMIKDFKNYRVNPFIYRRNASEMFFTVSDKVDLTEIIKDVDVNNGNNNNNDDNDNNRDDNITPSIRESFWPSFVDYQLGQEEDFLLNKSEDSLDEIIVVDDLKTIFDELYGNGEEIFFDFLKESDDYYYKIKRRFVKILKTAEMLKDKFQINIENYNTIRGIRKDEDIPDSDKTKIIELLDRGETTGDLIVIYNLIQKIQKDSGKDILDFLKDDLYYSYSRTTDQFVNNELRDQYFNGEYDDWIQEQI